MNTQFTSQEIRGAILRAADRIERLQSTYNFGSIEVPNECGSPACMIGWIGFELRAPRQMVNHFIHTMRTGVDPGTFGWQSKYAQELYDVCEAISPAYVTDPLVAARGMRAYADKFFPAETKALSTWIRQDTCSWADVPWKPVRMAGV